MQGSLVSPAIPAPKMVEGSSTWGIIADTLDKKDGFVVTQKSVRDHLNLLVAKRKQQLKKEERATGINVEESKLDNLMDNIRDDMEACEANVSEACNSKKAAEEKEKVVAGDVRKAAMEAFGETRKRHSNDGEDCCHLAKNGNQEATP